MSHFNAALLNLKSQFRKAREDKRKDKALKVSAKESNTPFFITAFFWRKESQRFKFVEGGWVPVVTEQDSVSQKRMCIWVWNKRNALSFLWCIPCIWCILISYSGKSRVRSVNDLLRLATYPGSHLPWSEELDQRLAGDVGGLFILFDGQERHRRTKEKNNTTCWSVHLSDPLFILFILGERHRCSTGAADAIWEPRKRYDTGARVHEIHYLGRLQAISHIRMCSTTPQSNWTRIAIIKLQKLLPNCLYLIREGDFGCRWTTCGSSWLIRCGWRWESVVRCERVDQADNSKVPLTKKRVNGVAAQGCSYGASILLNI